MAAITIEYVQPIDIQDAITVPSGEDVSSGRRGKYMRVDSTAGTAMLGNATSSGEIGGLHGMAISDQKYLGDSVTLVRRGLVDWGNALDGMSYGDPIYVSDTDGTFATTAGSTSTIVGRVLPVFSDDGSVKKLAYLNML